MPELVFISGTTDCGKSAALLGHALSLAPVAWRRHCQDGVLSLEPCSSRKATLH
ncbi:hypothetical protein ABT404_19225 [Streptomyces hyaluromycini]|uniref:Dethiobiotin synthase n=1 Tax=Streptomyces hyaluromycini TaxID=1377993 RepID=A0ABV1WXT2_9ACTN